MQSSDSFIHTAVADDCQQTLLLGYIRCCMETLPQLGIAKAPGSYLQQILDYAAGIPYSKYVVKT